MALFLRRWVASAVLGGAVDAFAGSVVDWCEAGVGGQA